MSDYYPSPIQGVWIPPLGYEQTLDVIEVFEGDAVPGAYVYVETLFGIPFDVEVYFPVLASILMAYQYGDAVEVLEVDALSVSSLTWSRRAVIEFAGSSDPSDYMRVDALHSIEELFFDEYGHFSLTTAMTILLQDLIMWRVGRLDVWEEVVESCVPIEFVLHENGSFRGGRVVFSRGRSRRKRRHRINYPPFSYPPNRGFIEMDKWIDDNGFILNAPIYEEIKEAEKAEPVDNTFTYTVNFNAADWSWGGDT